MLKCLSRFKAFKKNSHFLKVFNVFICSQRFYRASNTLRYSYNGEPLEIIYGLSNRAIFNDLERPRPRFQGQIILWRWISPKWRKIRPKLQWKANRKPHLSFQWYHFSTLSVLWPTFQDHDNIQRKITGLIVSRIMIQWFRFQWPWVTLNIDVKVTVSYLGLLMPSA